MESVNKYLLIRKILNRLDCQLWKVTVQILQRKLGLTIPWPNKEKQIKEKQAATLGMGRKQRTEVHLKTLGTLGASPEGLAACHSLVGLASDTQRKILDKPGMPSRCLVSQGAFPHTMSASEGKPQTHRTLCWNAVKPHTWTTHQLQPLATDRWKAARSLCCWCQEKPVQSGTNLGPAPRGPVLRGRGQRGEMRSVNKI